MLHISLAAEKIGSIAGFSVTNSLLATWFTMAILFLFTWAATRRMSIIPNGIQSIAELLIGGLYDFFGSVTGQHIKKFFPLVASIFLFVIMANWIGLLPGVGTIGFREGKSTVQIQSVSATHPSQELLPSQAETDSHSVAAEISKPDTTEETLSGEKTAHGEEATTEHAEKFVPLLRAATADLNMTLALAVTAVIAIQYFGFSLVGFHYSSRFLNFSNPIMLILGILELMSEVSKVISFAFRLFGNIFAGEVLLAVLAFLMPFVIPLPFLLMELFVGFIQALVFSMLTAVFLNVAVSHGEAVPDGRQEHH